MIPSAVQVASPRSSALRTFAVTAALLGWVALALQLWLTVGVVVAQGRGLVMGLVVYFGFFTILTNLLAALVLAALVLTAWGLSPKFPGFRLATNPVTLTTAAGAITIVGAVYFLILRHLWAPQGAQFLADAALHYLMPALVLLFWAWAVPAGSVRWRHAPWLLAYPLAYLVYVFARGEITGLYPYAFVDVLQLGYRVALANAAGLLLAYTAVVGLLIGLKAMLPRRAGAVLRRTE